MAKLKDNPIKATAAANAATALQWVLTRKADATDIRLSGHVWTLTGVGTLVVFASAATAVALQALLGMLGTGLVILLFVVLGNPSSGGVYPEPLLPPSGAPSDKGCPPGAGTTLVRNTVYLSGHVTAHSF